MDEEAFRRMYFTLIHTCSNDCEGLEEYAESFYQIWNKVCGNFKVGK